MSTGLDRCLQDFENVPRVANVFAMFAKMFAWFRNLFLRSWVADFYRYFHSIAAKMFAKMFIISQMCKNVCKFVRVCKNVYKKIFFVGGCKNNFYFYIVG